MAQSITNAFVTLFDAEVKQAYQGESSILGCVRLRQGVQGQTYKFPKLGKGSATARVPQTDVTPLNVTYSQVTATMSDYNAAEYSDIFHQAKVNFDERQELVQVVSKAIVTNCVHFEPSHRHVTGTVNILTIQKVQIVLTTPCITSGTIVFSNIGESTG